MRQTMLAAALAIALGVPAAQAAQQASLRFNGLRPLAVSGRGFAKHERVRVTAYAHGGHTTIRTRAGADGALTVTFATISIDTCDPVDVTAEGSRGAHARLLRRAPVCAPR